MDFTKKILPILWQIVDKKKYCAVNFSTFEDKLTVNILWGRRRKKFSHPNGDVLISQLQQFLAA